MMTIIKKFIPRHLWDKLVCMAKNERLRVSIDLTGTDLKEEITKIAEGEQRPLSAMMRLLLEEAVRTRKKVGDDFHVKRHLKSFLEKLMGGEQPSLVETVKVAEILDLDAEQLLKLRDSLTEQN